MEWLGDFIAGRTPVEVLRQDGGWLVPLGLALIAALGGLTRWFWKTRAPFVKRLLRGLSRSFSAAGAAAWRSVQVWAPVSRKRYETLRQQKSAEERLWQRDVRLGVLQRKLRENANLKHNDEVRRLNLSRDNLQHELDQLAKATTKLREQAPSLSTLFDDRGFYIGYPEPKHVLRLELISSHLALKNISPHPLSNMTIEVQTVQGDWDAKTEGWTLSPGDSSIFRPIFGRPRARAVKVAWTNPLGMRQVATLTVPRSLDSPSV